MADYEKDCFQNNSKRSCRPTTLHLTKEKKLLFITKDTDFEAPTSLNQSERFYGDEKE